MQIALAAAHISAISNAVRAELFAGTEALRSEVTHLTDRVSEVHGPYRSTSHGQQAAD
jgi:hypothetical protein